ncbi:hypothetical protein [Agromyces subbeticus]|uniref:hypothetical protein n=1 Tax=Agromyces subbeticus TaxID=293890 RepID=UPI0003B6FCD1|nr:hypothetical protein [Agromyces subbeticus]
MATLLDGWSEFNVAMLGATAALAGLLIVAMSVNIGEILKTPSLPGRAAAALAALMAAIIVTALGLVPDMPVIVYGLGALLAAVLATVFEYRAMRLIVAEGREHGSPIAKAAAGWLPVALFVAGAVAVLAGAPEAGLGLLAAACILAVASAILHAWIVLVEVLR